MSSFVLPFPVGSPISRWSVVDWHTPSMVSEPAEAGAAVIAFPQLDLDVQWMVDHMVVQCDSTTPTTLRLYDSTADPGQLLDGSRQGNFDVADWPSGLLIRPQSALLATWTGCSPGAVARLRLQLRIMRQGAG